MKCQKCGTELHEDQKVCIACGTRTIRGDNYSFGDKEPWRPTKNHIIGAASVLVLLIVLLIINAMRADPPKVVAEEWFNAMTQRKVKDARKLSTPDLEENLQSHGMDLMAISEEYYSDITSNGGSVKVSEPKPAGSKSTLSVDVSVSYNNGEPARQYNLEMVKVGKNWRMNKIL